MKNQGTEFDGSSSMFETKQILKPTAGNALTNAIYTHKSRTFKFCRYYYRYYAP